MNAPTLFDQPATFTVAPAGKYTVQSPPSFSAKLSTRDEPPLARATDPATSHDAAEDVRPKRKSQKAVLLAVFRAYPEGLTAEEACRIAGMERGGWKRISELLHRDKVLRATGETRTNRSGSQADVLAAVLDSENATP